MISPLLSIWSFHFPLLLQSQFLRLWVRREVLLSPKTRNTQKKSHLLSKKNSIDNDYLNICTNVNFTTILSNNITSRFFNNRSFQKIQCVTFSIWLPNFLIIMANFHFKFPRLNWENLVWFIQEYNDLPNLAMAKLIFR